MGQEDSDKVTADVTEQCLNMLQRRLSSDESAFEITGAQARDEVGTAVVVARMDADLTKERAENEVHIQIQDEAFVRDGDVYQAHVDMVGDVHNTSESDLPDRDVSASDDAYFAEITVLRCPS